MNLKHIVSEFGVSMAISIAVALASPLIVTGMLRTQNRTFWVKVLASAIGLGLVIYLNFKPENSKSVEK